MIIGAICLLVLLGLLAVVVAPVADPSGNDIPKVIVVTLFVAFLLYLAIRALVLG